MIVAVWAKLVSAFAYAGGLALYLWWTVGRPRRTERRRAEGRCLRCGYSLHGNLSGVCPECGTSTGR